MKKRSALAQVLIAVPTEDGFREIRPRHDWEAEQKFKGMTYETYIEVCDEIGKRRRMTREQWESRNKSDFVF